ncbi:integrase core domain-containing protein [Aquimarina sp. I32.4]|uniref:integrase core domain-containing protein n=1 Tax=Aquimarina sp. I32.4 TaxID=2053903 RepID=UPI000CDEE924
MKNNPLFGISIALAFISCTKEENKREKIEISMTEENHCYENAMAERVNGVLKDEFYLDQTFTNVAHAKKVSKSAINLYNEVWSCYLYSDRYLRRFMFK